jgi:hypothetical protein
VVVGRAGIWDRRSLECHEEGNWSRARRRGRARPRGVVEEAEAQVTAQEAKECGLKAHDAQDTSSPFSALLQSCVADFASRSVPSYALVARSKRTS